MVLAGSLAPAVDRAPLGRRCRKQESRLSEQYSPPAVYFLCVYMLVMWELIGQSVVRNFRRQLGTARCSSGPENTVGEGARLATRRELRGHLPSILLLLSRAFAVALHCVVPTSFYMLDVIRRPPEPLAYLCIAVLLAGSLAPAVDRAPSGRRCRKQETRLFEQYTFLQSTGWATPVSPWTPPPNLMISDIIRRPPSLWPICA